MKSKSTTVSLLTGIILLVIPSLVAFSCCNDQSEVSEPDKFPPLSDISLIKRGKYIADLGACNECHTPKVMTPFGPVPDNNRLMAGHPQDEVVAPIVYTNDWVLFSQGITTFIGPWGQSFAANLTPHPNGIGNWEFYHFKMALRKGKFKGIEHGRDIAPPMPWPMYRHMTDEDMYALFAYLKSLPPIDNRVPNLIPPDKLLTSNTKSK